MLPDEFLNIIRRFGRSPDGTDMLYHNSLFLEFTFWVVIAAVAVLLLYCRPKWLDGFEQRFAAFARRKVMAVVTVGVLALAVRCALLPLIPIPVQIVHDEYSYILGAETFAAGRLTNPAHPLWVHFESFHINMVPTYQSMYPPGQALFLSFGILLFGHPWWGVWMSIGLMCAAITWMLQGWMPPKWALLGGLFCVLRFATFSYWINSYWGGAVAATGGALLLGSLVRLLRKPTWLCGLLFAVGLAILANTRPYEGFAFAVPSVIYLLIWFIRKRAWRAEFLRSAMVPAAAVLVLVGGFDLYYNWRSTGNPLLMPYVVNEHTYHISRPFLWQTANPVPDYHHRVMRTFYCFHELPEYIKSRHSWGLEGMAGMKFKIYYEFLVWPLLFLTIISLWEMTKSRKHRLLPVTMLLVTGCLMIEAWLPHGHYAAPLVCVVVAAVLYGLRFLRTWIPGGVRVGLAVSRAIVLVVLAWSIFPLAQRIINPWLLTDPPYMQLPGQLENARLQAQLEQIPGEHLVIVHNHLTANGSQDWIYNKPDIDHAKVVWARDMGPEKNQELLDYFKHRKVWMVDENDGVMRLEAYDQHSAKDILASTRVPAAHGQSN